MEHIKLRSQQGEFEIEVSKKGIYYKADDKYLNVAELKRAVIVPGARVSKHLPNGEVLFAETYRFQVSHIDSGCKKQVPVEDWKKVLAAYDRLGKDVNETPRPY